MYHKLRGLPCNCENNDPFGIRWIISGHIKDGEESMGGILEWCTSFEDAVDRFQVLSNKLHAIPSTIKAEPFKTQKIVYVAAGFKVLVFFDHRTISLTKDINDIYFSGEVVEVTERYGYHGDKKDLPLLKVVRDSDGKKIHLDQSFVIAILDRKAKNKAPYNAFKKCKRKEGSIKSSLTFHLGRLPFEVPDRPIREDVMRLYKKDGSPGLKKSYRGIPIEINHKVLAKWVRSNWSRLLMTKKGLDRIVTEQNKEREADYWRDIEGEMYY